MSDFWWYLPTFVLYTMYYIYLCSTYLPKNRTSFMNVHLGDTPARCFFMFQSTDIHNGKYNYNFWTLFISLKSNWDFLIISSDLCTMYYRQNESTNFPQTLTSSDLQFQTLAFNMQPFPRSINLASNLSLMLIIYLNISRNLILLGTGQL